MWLYGGESLANAWGRYDQRIDRLANALVDHEMRPEKGHPAVGQGIAAIKQSIDELWDMLARAADVLERR